MNRFFRLMRWLMISTVLATFATGCAADDGSSADQLVISGPALIMFYTEG